MKIWSDKMLENLSNQDIIILCCLICLVFIIGIICIFLTMKKDKTKTQTDEKMEVEKTEPDINVALATENIPTISEKEPTLDEILNISDREEEVILEKDVVDNMDKETEQDTLNRLSIEEVLRVMNDDLEKQKYAAIDKYEEEQEENAVISYQELVARKLALGSEKEEPEKVTETTTRTAYIDDGNNIVPVSIEQTKTVEHTPTGVKFSNSEFISPIFGRLEDTTEYPTVKKIEEVESYKETTIREELPKENDEFLSTLKEFRKNL